MRYYRVFVHWGEYNLEGAAVEISKDEADYLLDQAERNHEIEKEKMSNGDIWYKVEGKTIMIEGEKIW